jgi:hypothetical protein
MSTPEPEKFEYDVALSLAGEDRGYVQPIAARLRECGVAVFYYEFEQSKMWGLDLVVFLDEVFRKKSRYAVAFISRHYVEKHWPTHERESAQARALVEDSPYFLPVRLDDSELPGLRPTVGYIDARETGRDKLIDLILTKVTVSPPVERTPRTPEEEALLLSSRPDGWEYLLFASTLLRERNALDPSWHDHELGYTKPHGPPLEGYEAHALLLSAIGEARVISGNLEKLLSPESTERAFGALGESGDPDFIRHLADRVIDTYRQYLDWSARLRGANVLGVFERAFEISAQFVDGPIRQIREWVDVVVAEMDRLPERIRNKETITMTLTLTIAMNEGTEEEFDTEMRRLQAEFS